MGTTGYEKHLEADKGTVLDIFEQATPPSVSGKASKREVKPENIIAPIKSWADGSRIDLIPSSLELSWTLKNPSGKEQLLTLFLDEVRSSYDLILIDCAPTESMLTTAAYLAELIEQLVEMPSDDLEQMIRHTVVEDRKLGDEYERWVRLILQQRSTGPDA